MNKLILASDNAHKFREFSEILSGTDTQVILRSEAGCGFEIEETGTTFAENAYIKAKSVTDYTGLPAVADDSGICVDHLGGGPGIFSARYGAGMAHNDHERMMYLLDQMKNADVRSARYVCSICCTFPDGDVIRALASKDKSQEGLMAAVKARIEKYTRTARQYVRMFSF